MSSVDTVMYSRKKSKTACHFKNVSQPVVQLQMQLVCQSLKNEPELLLVMVSLLCACACVCELCHNQKVSECTVVPTKTLYGHPEAIFCQVQV